MKVRYVRGMTVALMAVLAFSANAVADNEFSSPIGFYLGADLGFTDADVTRADLGVPSGAGHLDDNDFAYGVNFGHKYNDYVSSEIGYRNFGKVGVTGAGQNALVDASAWSLSVVGYYPMDNYINLTAKAGVAAWDVDSFKSSGTSLLVGLGAEYELNRDLLITLDWERYNEVANLDYTIVTIGSSFRF